MDRTISRADVETVFRSRVRPAVFGADDQQGIDRTAGERPVLVLLGGQQGAGKSSAEEAITRRHPGIAYVTGDDFRRHHPDFERLVIDDPLRMPEVTAQLSGPLVRRCIDHALGRQYSPQGELIGTDGPRRSMVLEGVFAQPDMVVGGAEEFAAAGFDVHVVTMGVSEHDSRLSAENRYLEMAEINPLRARWTSPELHDLAYHNLPETVRRLEASPAVTSHEVWTRDGCQYSWTRASGEPSQASAHVLAARARLDPERWSRSYEQTRQIAASLTVSRGDAGAVPYLSDPRTGPAWRQLDSNHARLNNQPDATANSEPATARTEGQKLADLMRMTFPSPPTAQPPDGPASTRPYRPPAPPRRGPGLGR